MQRIVRFLAFELALAGFAVLSADVCLAGDTSSTLVVPSSPSAVDITVDLPESFQPDSSKAWRLVEGTVSAPVQWLPAIAEDGSAANSRRLTARIPGAESGEGVRRFKLLPADAASPAAKSPFEFKEKNDAAIGLFDKNRPVMVYNHGTITCEQVPENDNRRTRACYVHPVWGLDGEVLTDDFPKDHYHHHGIFWAWPHVGVDGREYDLWIYRDIQQRFVRWIHRQTGPLAGVLAVENGWFVGERKVMVERVWMRCHTVDNGHRAIDFEFTWLPVDKPITLWGAGGKSYGGLNFRFAPREDTRITVPAGLTKADLPDTPLEWADLTAKFPDAPGPSGAAIFVHPAHPDFPPTWLTRHYGVLCVGWPGVEPQTFEPGKPIKLGYRVWIHKGAPEAASLKVAYDAYKAAMAANWE